ncbi:MAG: DUF1015 domain-containing protein [Deltaproteobacteria bacterium]|nr:DUF1015 domain-containing protein [Deltaproteobacteria bacterium]
MAKIFPFRGLTYNPGKAGDLSSVMAPPYDVISPEHQAELYARSPRNVVRIDFSRDADPYSTVPERFREWQDEGTLVPEDAPAIYYLSQEYRLADGVTRERRGFIALAAIEDFGDGAIHGHEATLAEPREDRLKLMLACDAQFSSILALYNDEKPTLTDALREHVRSHKPKVEAELGEFGTSRLWAVTDPGLIGMVREALREQAVFIADGHHRYEAAGNYRRRRLAERPGATGDEGFNRVMMYFANLNEEGVVILPTHRLVREMPPVGAAELEEKLRRYFQVEAFSRDAGGRRRFLETLEQPKDGERVLGAAFKDDARYLALRPGDGAAMAQLAPDMSPELRGLDVTTLHVLLMEHVLGVSTRDAVNTDAVAYTHDAEEALAEAEAGRCQAALILNPPTAGEMIAVSLKGEKMPQKSTYFFPKLVTGLVIHKVED